MRSEAILDGIFSQAVVVVEADSDRTVYQAVWETLVDEHQLDIHFATVGGTGGIADTCRLYQTLRIPVAVVADLDVVLDVKRLERILSELAPADVVTECVAKARQIAAEIKLLPPTVAAEDVKVALEQVQSLSFDWSQGADLEIKSRLAHIVRDLDRMKRVKSGGLSNFPRPLAEKLDALLANLSAVGVFLVPVGELEGWLATRALKASRAAKWAWANEAAARIRHVGAQHDDVWSFVRHVSNFLRGRLDFRDPTGQQACRSPDQT